MQIRSLLTGGCCFALFGAVGIIWAGSLSNADKRFMILAAHTDMTEAHEGHMAENRASQTNVKELGKTLVQDYTKSYDRLTELAGKTGVKIPKGIDADKDQTIEQLARLKGPRFDHQFTSDEIVAHRHAIAVFKREAKHGQDADVKAYAANIIPALEKDLHLAEECSKRR